MALWNYLVPDLVQLGVQERETDKLPHSRYPSVPGAENEYDLHRGTDKKKSTVRDQEQGPTHYQQPPRTPSTTFGRERIAEVGLVFLPLSPPSQQNRATKLVKSSSNFRQAMKLPVGETTVRVLMYSFLAPNPFEKIC